MAGRGTVQLRGGEDATLRVENLVQEFPVGRNRVVHAQGDGNCDDLAERGTNNRSFLRGQRLALGARRTRRHLNHSQRAGTPERERRCHGSTPTTMPCTHLDLLVVGQSLI